MSLQTWKDEFYPKPASETEVSEAAAHSLQKWIGLRESNLAKHGVKVLDGSVVERGIMSSFVSEDCRVDIDADSCSLCHHYHSDDGGEYDEKLDDYTYCAECPLYKARGGYQCDQRTPRENSRNADAPWQTFAYAGSGRDPEPMIRWLRKVVKASQ